MGERLAERVEVRRATVAEKVVVRHLMQFYSHDFAEMEDGGVLQVFKSLSQNSGYKGRDSLQIE